jgi:hypothetical protein
VGAWLRVFCVLKGPVVYVFSDDLKLDLSGVINVGPTSTGEALRSKRAAITQVGCGDHDGLTIGSSRSWG